MSTTKVRSNNARGPAGVDMRLEVVAIAVSDADRAKEFYGSLGVGGSTPTSNGDDFRLIQFMPPGAGCSIQSGTNLTSAALGSVQSLYLIVFDLEAARDELVMRGIEVSELFRESAGGEGFHPGSDARAAAQDDANWPDWYARYMVDVQAGRDGEANRGAGT